MPRDHTLKPGDPWCPECHGRDLYAHECYTCGAEAIDLPRNQECPGCTVDGCGGGNFCKWEQPDMYPDPEDFL